MKLTKSICVLTVVVFKFIGHFPIVSAQAGDGTVAGLSPNIIAELLSIVINGTVHLLGNCTADQNGSRVQYWMYNRQNPNGYLMSNFDGVDYSSRLEILVHGWGGNRDVDYLKAIRDAYLKRYSCNIITTDFGYYVGGDYISAVCNLPAVVTNFAQFLCNLDQYYALSKLHIVAHSLGAQMTGRTGHRVQEQCQLSVGRITGLDPAGPGFQGVLPRDRLDATDADFVDIIHTNQGQYGYVGNLGDIDFYPNCGTFQPGCLAIINNVTLANITNFPIKYINCNHQRSCYLFAESILKNDFLASPMLSPFLCMKTLHNSTDDVYMGEYCRSSGTSHSYYVKTHAQSPYGLGPDGPLH